jgi:hypothetical protein
VKCRSQPEEQAREHRHHKREEQNRGVEQYHRLIWDCVLWNEGENGSEAPKVMPIPSSPPPIASSRLQSAAAAQSRASGTERSRMTISFCSALAREREDWKHRTGDQEQQANGAK